MDGVPGGQMVAVCTSRHTHSKLLYVFYHLAANKINGPSLLNLNTSQMNILGATNSIIQRKLMRWIKEGFAEFEDYLTKSNLENKENIPPLQQKKTTQREILKSRPQKSFNSKDEEMVIRSCDGNIAAFYVMK